MIDISKWSTSGWEAAVRGMRNPLNSWDKSDSVWPSDEWPLYSEENVYTFNKDVGGMLGEADLKLMNHLALAGSDHAKFRRMITVYVDILAPLYWWPEMDSYKIGTVSNGCSKMHTLLNRPFEVSDFSFERLPGYKREIIPFVPEVTEDMIEDEQWRPIEFAKEYEVSNFGRCRRLTKNGKRIIYGSRHNDGYIFVTIHGQQYPLHRLIGYMFLRDSYSSELVMNHKDGNKQNNFVSNLEWVTQKENVHHSYINNLQPKTSKTYLGKFTAEEREQIKLLWESGEMTKRQIARKYNVSHTCINDIISERYKYIDQANVFKDLCIPLVDDLNELRDLYFRTIDSDAKKDIWYSIISLLPSSYNQKRTLMLNYEVLARIYAARRDHKLDEWHVFCEWIEKLPYAKEIIFPRKGEE